ncbi:MAG: hypothetical protein LBE32_00495 [Burkholderiales bacterium]|jgi:hypothetical protein|nr:hypothetical protein [Burkholderiales bacterium]
MGTYIAKCVLFGKVKATPGKQIELDGKAAAPLLERGLIGEGVGKTDGGLSDNETVAIGDTAVAALQAERDAAAKALSDAERALVTAKTAAKKTKAAKAVDDAKARLDLAIANHEAALGAAQAD